MITEQIVSIGSRMYECRRACHTLFGAKYSEMIDPYGKVIQHVAAERGIETIPAALAMAKEMQALHKDPIITLCLMAAAVDLVEPEPPRKMLPGLPSSGN